MLSFKLALAECSILLLCITFNKRANNCLDTQLYVMCALQPVYFPECCILFLVPFSINFTPPHIAHASKEVLWYTWVLHALSYVQVPKCCCHTDIRIWYWQCSHGSTIRPWNSICWEKEKSPVNLSPWNSLW